MAPPIPATFPTRSPRIVPSARSAPERLQTTSWNHNLNVLNAQLATMVVLANSGSTMDFCSFYEISFPVASFFFLSHSGRIILFMTYSTYDKFNGSALSTKHSTAKWFKIDQIGNTSDGGYKYQQDIGAHHSPCSFNLFF